MSHHPRPRQLTGIVRLSFLCLAGLARASAAPPPVITLAPAAESSCVADPITPSGKSQLRRRGAWLVDGQGRVVITHGVNMVWKLAPYVPPATLEGFLDRDSDWLAAHGFNSARVGTLFTGIMPTVGGVDTGYLDAWDRVVQSLARNHIYTLFDFHQDLYHESFQGEGFPTWSLYNYLSPSNTSVLGFPTNYFTEPTQAQYDGLLNDAVTRTGQRVWPHFRDAWTAVARRWRDQPYVMGYDLLNEPWPGVLWQPCAAPNPAGCPSQDSKLQTFFDNARQGVRSVDPDNLVWYEPFLLFDFGSANHFTPVAGESQLGFSWHDYCLTGAFAHAAGATDIPGCQQLHQLVHANAATATQRLSSASLITEFGASDDLADIRQVVTLADQSLVGWQYWHYKNWRDPTTESQTTSTQSLFTDDTDLSTLKPAKARILIRPYPQYTAGTPTSLSFNDTTSVMEYRYRPNAASAPTELFVPLDIHYPSGYRVEVTGAQAVTPSEDGARLSVTAAPGACEVRVVVRPPGT